MTLISTVPSFDTDDVAAPLAAVSRIRLPDLHVGDRGIIVALVSSTVLRETTMRMMALGFRVGRRIRVVAAGPFGGGPWAVEVGGRVFALRRHEASHIEVARD
jgi:Fe2+ transport system protein FeoA